MRILFSVILIMLTVGFIGDGWAWPALIPALPALEVRLWIVGSLLALALLIWATPKLWRRWRKHRELSEEELYFRREKAHIRNHLNDLRLHLKRQFRGGSNSYHLPWVLVSGPEKAGSSRWLTAAGFEPICRKEETFNAEVQLWISEQAVAVEVSSSLLLQENSLLEKPIWDYLLQQLRLHRPRQPISTSLLLLDSRRLLGSSESALAQLAQAYRRRSLELRALCGGDLPILLQLTQADQLDGFDAWSGALGGSDRQQPQGFVVDEKGQKSFDQAMHRWQQSIAEPLQTLLQNQTSLPRRQALMRFVLQLEMVQERVCKLYQQLNQGDRFGPGIALRGLFISSAGQQGSAQPWLAQQLVSAQFQTAAPAVQLPGHEGIFLTQQVTRVIQPLAAGQGQNALAAAGWRLSVLASSAALVTLLAGAGWVYWLNLSHNQQLETQVDVALARYETDMEGLGSGQLTPLIEPLSQLRLLVSEVNQQRPWYLNIGLFNQQLASQVQQAYNNQLGQRLLPVLASLTEGNLAAYVHLSDEDGVFEHLQHYLMLFNADLREPQPLTDYLLKSLLVHEDILVQDELPLAQLFGDLWLTDAVPDKENSQLVAEARSQLDRIIDERLVYEYIKSRPELARTLDMRERLSGQFSQVFRFSPGYEGYYIPYLYTRDGYLSLDLSADSPLLSEAINRLEKVKSGRLEASYATLSRVSDRIREIYFADYIRIWRGFLSNIELREATNNSELDSLVRQLYSGEQPVLYRVSELVAAETRLVDESEGGDSKAGKQAQKLAERKVAKALGIKGPVKKIAKTAANERLAKLAAQRNASIVNRAFDSWAGLFAERGEGISTVLDSLQEEQDTLRRHAYPDQAVWQLVSQVNQGQSNVLDEIDNTARPLPKEARRWFASLTDQVWDQWRQEAERYLQVRWEQEVYADYRRTVAGRFPLVAAARKEIRLGAFTSFFGPQGQIDSFFDTYLKAFVDSSGPNWFVRSNQRRALAINPSYLRSQQYLSRVQSLLFTSDSGQLNIPYQIRPEQLSVDVTTFGLRTGAQQLEYRHGPRQWQAGNWPVQDANPDLTLYFESNGLRLAQQRFSGPWALWRFAWASEQFPLDDGVQLEFSLRDYRVKLGLQLDSAANPFDPNLLGRLQIPQRIIAGN